MKAKVWIEYSDEVEVDIDKEHILAALSESPEPGENWRHVLNRFAIVLRALPDAEIETWNPKVNQAISSFLSEQAIRFGQYVVKETYHA